MFEVSIVPSPGNPNPMGVSYVAMFVVKQTLSNGGYGMSYIPLTMNQLESISDKAQNLLELLK